METKSKSYDYSDILESFGIEKIEKRYDTIYQYLDAFIKRKKYTDNVCIAPSVLNQAIIDYFVDVHRLKEFHNIEAINYLKIHAYMGYWLLRRKPLQIIKDNPQDINLAFVNEMFVASYLLQYLRGEYTKIIISEEERLSYFEFVKNLEYYLRYRTVTPQMIETMLEAYQAGMSFQKSIENYK